MPVSEPLRRWELNNLTNAAWSPLCYLDAKAMDSSMRAVGGGPNRGASARSRARLGSGVRRGLALAALCAGGLVGCIKESTHSFLDAATSSENQAQLDVLRDRTSRAVHDWSRAAVTGAMEGWSDADQAAFREQTARLSRRLADQAVAGALDAATDPATVERVELALAAVLQATFEDVGKGVRVSLSPAVDDLVDRSAETLARDLEQKLGPAVAKTLHDDLFPELAQGVRQELGPALADVIRDDVAKPLEADIAPSLAKVVGASVEAPLGRVMDRLERLSDKTREDAVDASRKIAWALGIALGVLLVGGAVAGVLAWRRAKAQLRTVELLAGTIKKFETEPGVQRLIAEVRSSGIGTEGGDYLKRFLSARPSLRAHHPVAAPAE
jgi:hypothetical protein